MTNDPSLLGLLTNFGIRAPDLEAELVFLGALGASPPERRRLLINGRVSERVFVDFHGTRLGIFRKASYDETLAGLGEERSGGLSHVSFASPDTYRLLHAAAEMGVDPLMGPYEVQMAEGGTGLVTYFRSPNGTVIQGQQRL